MSQAERGVRVASGTEREEEGEGEVRMAVWEVWRRRTDWRVEELAAFVLEFTGADGVC
jgi:hypothetical protein